MQFQHRSVNQAKGCVHIQTDFLLKFCFLMHLGAWNSHNQSFRLQKLSVFKTAGQAHGNVYLSRDEKQGICNKWSSKLAKLWRNSTPRRNTSTHFRGVFTLGPVQSSLCVWVWTQVWSHLCPSILNGLRHGSCAQCRWGVEATLPGSKAAMAWQTRNPHVFTKTWLYMVAVEVV